MISEYVNNLAIGIESNLVANELVAYNISPAKQ
jgi:hypothetical protein